MSVASAERKSVTVANQSAGDDFKLSRNVDVRVESVTSRAKVSIRGTVAVTSTHV
jgi:hypothetical protein